MHRPYTLIAELTYRCPLRCPYCSNPVGYERFRSEIDTPTWTRVFAEAEELGVVQLHLTGGEPLLRKDLVELCAAAHALNLYTNLITSGIPLERERLVRLKEAGLDNLQLSIQDVDQQSSDEIAGYVGYQKKLEVARWVKELELPLTINVVLHRQNLGRVAEIISFAEGVKADRLELANTQYLGWALENRAALLPTRAQLDRGREIAAAARARLAGKMEVLYVLPDYYSGWPKACMDGWGRRFINLTPDGRVLPCHAAHDLPLEFENVRDRPLGEIWRHSSAINRFRGTDWMSEPCASCERREVDFGGCRCQAFRLLGDAALTDPVCQLSPNHGLVEAARAEATLPKLIPPGYLYRGPRGGRVA